MQATPERAPLSREIVVAQARELISREGLEQLSLRRLATELGVTAPALYAHVEDKQDLLRAVAEEEFTALLARFDGVTETDPLARIRALGRAYVQHAQCDRERFKVMFLFPPDLGGAALAPEGAELPAATKAFAAAAGAVEEAVRSGDLVTDDPLLAALTLWSGVHGVASVLQLGFDLPPELEATLIDEVTDRILLGYAAGQPDQG